MTVKRPPRRPTMTLTEAGDTSGILSLLNQRRRQMMVHSELYYRMNESIVSDQTFDRWARELVDLQKKYPAIAKQGIHADLFEGFDGTTGYHLVGVPWVTRQALHLLQSHKERIS